MDLDDVEYLSCNPVMYQQICEYNSTNTFYKSLIQTNMFNHFNVYNKKMYENCITRLAHIYIIDYIETTDYVKQTGSPTLHVGMKL